MSAQKTKYQEKKLQPIAIIGIGCRYPGGVDNTEDLMQLLRNEIDAITEIPKSRFDTDKYYSPEVGLGKIVTRKGGTLSNIDQFDAPFFGISPREASLIDPQHRLLLEVTWEAMESAGQIPKQMAATKTGVFIGIWSSDYETKILGASDKISLQALLGSHRYSAAGRVSYVFDFQGPCMVVDTACSSALVAVHLACQSIWSGESSMAVAGGVNLILEPDLTIACSGAGMLSPEARCKFGDASANGYVRSDGVGTVLLKPLKQAIKDNDPVFALIRGTASNNDGRTGGMLSVPSKDKQVDVMRDAYLNACLSPGEVTFMEAHGTGTPTGDPIEIQALGEVVGKNRSPESPCLIGSIKTNIGHTEAGAGAAALIKAALCLNNRELPASLHFNEPNPNVPWSDLPLKIQKEGGPLPKSSNPAVAGVNSFGVTGTNAHVVLQEFVHDPVSSHYTKKNYLIPYSAHSPEALKDLIQSHINLLSIGTRNGFSFDDYVFTNAVRRTHHTCRAALVATGREELPEQLEKLIRNERFIELASSGEAKNTNSQPVFVFSGMGAKSGKAANELLDSEPVFRSAFEECDAIFKKLAGWSLLEAYSSSDPDSGALKNEFAQPLNFALQVALDALWRSWGVLPGVVVGHSSGEAAAAYAAGVLSLSDATKVIYHRSQIERKTTGEGKMISVGLSLNELLPLLAGYGEAISVAAVNSPSSVTLSGSIPEIEKIVLELEAKRIFVHHLPLDIPHHSNLLNGLEPELKQSLQGIEVLPAKVPIYETVTGGLADGKSFNPGYWWKNVRETVHFSDAIANIIGQGFNKFIEISSHPLLLHDVSACLRLREQEEMVLPSLHRDRGDFQQLFDSLGKLYSSGTHINWDRLYPKGNCLTFLPTYPFQRETVWLDNQDTGKRAHQVRYERRTNRPGHPFLQSHLELATNNEQIWQLEIDLEALSYLKDHRFGNSIVFPGAAYLEMALAAAREVFPENNCALEDVSFNKALVLSAKKPSTGQLVVAPISKTKSSFKFFSRLKGNQKRDWTLHAEGVIVLEQTSFSSRFDDSKLAKEHYQNTLTRSRFYELAGQHLLKYGPCFQGIEELWQKTYEAMGTIRLPEILIPEENKYNIHPVLLDSAIQTILAAILDSDFSDESEDAFLPVGLDTFQVYSPPGSGPFTAHSEIKPVHETNGQLLSGDIHLLNMEGKVIFELKGLKLQKVASDNDLNEVDDLLYQNQWFQQPAKSIPNREPENTQPRTWVVLLDNNEIGTKLCSELTNKGDTCIIVRPGGWYEKKSEEEYTLDHKDPSGFRKLYMALQQAGVLSSLQGILFMWGMDSDTSVEPAIDSLTSAQDLGSTSVLYLVQALVDLKSTPPPLWLVTKETQAVLSKDNTLSIAQAAIWGLGRVIIQEHPELSCKMIDLGPTDHQKDIAAFCRELDTKGNDDHVAFRSGIRYVARLVSTSIASPPADVASGTQIVPVKPGSYLISGGLGGLGLVVAEWLVSQGAKHLILLSRKGIPSSSAKKTLQKMEDSGVKIHLAKADVASESQIVELLQTIKQTMPPLRGVVHAAGVLADGVLSRLGKDHFDLVMAPKINGAWNLHHATLDENLDFFVLFSSVTSLLGTVGQGNYAAANAFLDALAHYRKGRGLPGLSLNWGAWSEVGMAASQANRGKRMAEQGMLSISPKQGVEHLAKVLNSNISQIGIFRMDWGKCFQSQFYSKDWSYLARIVEEKQDQIQLGESQKSMSSILKSIFDAPQDNQLSVLVSHIKHQISEVVKLPPDKIKHTATMQDLGIDSMFSVELRKNLESSLELKLSSSVLWNYPTLEAISGYLAERIGITTGTTEKEKDALPEASTLNESDESLLKEILEKAEG